MNKPKKISIAVNVRVTQEDIDQLKIIAERERTTISTLIRQAIIKLLKDLTNHKAR